MDPLSSSSSAPPISDAVPLSMAVRSIGSVFTTAVSWVGEQLQSGAVQATATPILTYLTWGDERLLEELTGSREIFAWIETVSPFLPDWLPTDSRKKLALHFIASSVRALKYPGKVETGTLIVDFIQFYEIRLRTIFEEVETLTRREGVFPEERHFAKGATEMMQCALPESRGLLSSYVRRFLFECYTAMHVSLVEPDPLGFKEEIESVIRTEIRYFFSQKLTLENLEKVVGAFAPEKSLDETKRALTHCLVSYKPRIEALEEPLTRFAIRKIGEHFKRVPAKSGSEYLNYLAKSLSSHSSPEAITQLFLGDLKTEARIPLGIRGVVLEAVNNKLIPRYGEPLNRIIALLTQEGGHGPDGKMDSWTIRSSLGSAIDQIIAGFYPNTLKIIPKRLGEALLKEFLLHLLRNFSREIELPPPSAQALIEMAIQFAIEKLEIGFKGVKTHPSKQAKPLEDALEALFARLLPGALMPPIAAHKKGGELLFQLWKIHESFDPEAIENGYKLAFPGKEDAAVGFCITFDALVADCLRPYKKLIEAPYALCEGMKVDISGFLPFLSRIEQVLKVLGFEWIHKEMKNVGDHSVEAYLVNRLSQLRILLPERYEEENPLSWRPFVAKLFAELPDRIPYREKLFEAWLPALLVTYKEPIRLLVEQEAIDRGIIAINPFRGDPAIEPAVELMTQICFGDKDRYPPSFTHDFVRRGLSHFMARMTHGMRGSITERTPFSRLFAEGVAGFEEGRSEGMLARMAALIHPALVPLVRGQGKQIEPYLKPFLSKDKPLLQRQLFDALSGVSEGQTDLERATRIHEFTAHRKLIEDLVKGTSAWIVTLTLNYHSSKKSPFPFLRDIYSRSDFAPLKAIFSEKIEETITHALLHIVRTFKRGEAPIANKDLIRIFLNEAIRIIRAHAPSRGLAKVEANWIPVIRHLFQFAFEDPLAIIPAPEAERAKGLAAVEKMLAELAVEWHERIYRYIEAADDSRASLKRTLGPNTVALFATVLGRRWIPEFIPYIMQNEKEAIAESAAEWVSEEIQVELSPDAFILIKETLQDFAKEYPLVFDDGNHSAVYELSHWVGEYAEGYVLKLLSAAVERLKDLKSDRPLLLVFLEQVIPGMSEYYDLVQTLKKRHNVDRVDALPRSVWVQALEPKGLRSRALPAGIRSEPPLDVVRKAHFELLSARLVNSFGLDFSTAPFPPPLEEEFQRILVKLVLANTLLAIETSILENRGEFLLEGYNAIKQASKKLSGQVDKVKEAPVAVDPHLKKKLGDILVSVVAKLPNHPWAPVMEIRQLKQATGEQLVDLLATEDIFIRLNEIFETIIPKLVPGEVVSVRSGDFEFKPDPTEKISFTTKPKNRAELIRQIRKVGAEAFMSGLESILKERLRQEKRQIEAYTAQGFDIMSRFLRGAQDPGASKSRLDEILEDLFDWVKYVCEKGYTFLIDVVLIPLIIGILYIPYHLLIRWPLTFYFSYLAKNIYDEVTASYHEGVLLNLIDAFVDAIVEDRRGGEKI